MVWREEQEEKEEEQEQTYLLDVQRGHVDHVVDVGAGADLLHVGQVSEGVGDRGQRSEVTSAATLDSVCSQHNV